MKTAESAKACVLAGCLAIVSAPAVVWAQSQVAVRELGPAEVTSENLIEVLKPHRPVWKARAVHMVAEKPPCSGHRSRGINLMNAPAPVADVAAMKVEFAFNSAELTPEATTVLRTLGQALRSGELESYCFQIEGHTDDVGSEAYNDSLSQRRAESVVRYLSQQGVEAARLVAVGRGEHEPLTGNDSESSRQRNRRVQVLNLGAGVEG